MSSAQPETPEGRMTTVFKLADKVAAFKAKLDFVGTTSEQGSIRYVPNISGDFGKD